MKKIDIVNRIKELECLLSGAVLFRKATLETFKVEYFLLKEKLKKYEC